MRRAIGQWRWHVRRSDYVRDDDLELIRERFPQAELATIAAAVLLLAIVQSGLRYRSAISAGNLVLRIVVQLRSDVYDKLQRLSFRFFDANGIEFAFPTVTVAGGSEATPAVAQAALAMTKPTGA